MEKDLLDAFILDYLNKNFNDKDKVLKFLQSLKQDQSFTDLYVAIRKQLEDFVGEKIKMNFTVIEEKHIIKHSPDKTYPRKTKYNRKYPPLRTNEQKIHAYKKLRSSREEFSKAIDNLAESGKNF